MTVKMMFRFVLRVKKYEESSYDGFTVDVYVNQSSWLTDWLIFSLFGNYEFPKAKGTNYKVTEQYDVIWQNSWKVSFTKKKILVNILEIKECTY